MPCRDFNVTYYEKSIFSFGFIYLTEIADIAKSGRKLMIDFQQSARRKIKLLEKHA